MGMRTNAKSEIGRRRRSMRLAAVTTALGVVTLTLAASSTSLAGVADEHPEVPASPALDALSDWAVTHRAAASNMGGLILHAETLVVQWKGPVPASLEAALESFSPAVEFTPVALSATEIAQAGERMGPVLPDGSTICPEPDYSGLVVQVPPGAHLTDVALAAIADLDLPVRVTQDAPALVLAVGDVSGGGSAR